MFIKMMIVLGILMVMYNVPSINYYNIKNNLKDDELQAMIVILDKSLVNYYCTHSGNLPTALDGNTLKVMGLQDYDWTDFKYTPGTKQFTLTIKLNSGSTFSSANSGKTLIDVDNTGY